MYLCCLQFFRPLRRKEYTASTENALEKFYEHQSDEANRLRLSSSLTSQASEELSLIILLVKRIGPIEI